MVLKICVLMGTHIKLIIKMPITNGEYSLRGYNFIVIDDLDTIKCKSIFVMI